MRTAAAAPRSASKVDPANARRPNDLIHAFSAASQMLPHGREGKLMLVLVDVTFIMALAAVGQWLSGVGKHGSGSLADMFFTPIPLGLLGICIVIARLAWQMA